MQQMSVKAIRFMCFGRRDLHRCFTDVHLITIQPYKPLIGALAETAIGWMIMIDETSSGPAKVYQRFRILHNDYLQVHTFNRLNIINLRWYSCFFPWRIIEFLHSPIDVDVHDDVQVEPGVVEIAVTRTNCVPHGPSIMDVLYNAGI